MENTESAVEYKISNHAMKRYAERIMGKEDSTDVNQFVTLNEDKIKIDINKLIKYGEVIYTGKQSQKDGKGNVVDVHLKDTWIILADGKVKNVITLYKIDLGLDDEFNKSYVSKMIDKLNSQKANLEQTKLDVKSESDMYREMINDAESQIKEYRSMIKNLEELCVGYKSIIDNNCVKVSQANRELTEVLNTLIGRREF